MKYEKWTPNDVRTHAHTEHSPENPLSLSHSHFPFGNKVSSIFVKEIFVVEKSPHVEWYSNKLINFDFLSLVFGFQIDRAPSEDRLRDGHRCSGSLSTDGEGKHSNFVFFFSNWNRDIPLPLLRRPKHSTHFEWTYLCIRMRIDSFTR